MSRAGYTGKHRNKPALLMGIGVALMVIFIIMEFLFIMQVLPNTSFIPHFVGYAASVGGMFMAIIGFVTDYKDKRRQDQ